MTLKFYTTRSLPKNPKEAPWSHGHHNVPQEYIQTLLKQKIPDSELISSSSGEIAKLLSKGSSEVTQKEKEEFLRFERAKYDLMREFGDKINYVRKSKALFRINTRQDESRRDLYSKYETEIKRAMYQKYENERSDFKYCLNNWIEDEDSILAKLETQTFPIKSDISGIIIPIAHADWCDLPWIISGIQGDFKNRLEKKVTEIKEWEVKEEIEGRYFFDIFNIPVFNSPDFAPGHRHINRDNKSYNDWLIEGTNFRNDWKEKIKHVEFAYGLWLDRNFTKKD